MTAPTGAGHRRGADRRTDEGDQQVLIEARIQEIRPLGDPREEDEQYRQQGGRGPAQLREAGADGGLERGLLEFGVGRIVDLVLPCHRIPQRRTNPVPAYPTQEERLSEGLAMRTETTPSRDDAHKPPRHCPECGHDLSEYPYYLLRPSPFARKLQRLAAMLLPAMTVLFLVLLFRGAFLPSFSIVSGYFILAFICAPSLLRYSVSLLMPRTRRALCLHCSWYHDYPFSWGPFEARSEADQPASV